ncbi:hypothetical protein QEG16_001029 [Stenotrophomonas maltophilia]|nr:hypothetical protein [Stenotrophomonas maltophilia]
MSMPQIFITPAGFAAIVNAENTGTAPVKLTQVGLTSQAFDPASIGQALPGEFKRITTFGGATVAPDTLHLNVRDDGTDTYTVRGFGLYLADGTLFGVYSQATPIMEKAAAATLLLATDIRFANIGATSIAVGDVDFVNPPATTTRAGVVRLATDQEADSASDNTIALSARGLSRYINGRFGEGAPSQFVKKLLGAATAAIFRTELQLKSAALRDEGAGNGLDSDMLDGSHGSYYLDWRNFVGVPNSFNPVPHGHSIGDVTDLQAALDSKFDKSGGTITGQVTVRGGTLRVQGFGGAQSAGRVALGDAGAYLQYDQGEITTYDPVSRLSTQIAGGGKTWTTGTFDPATKITKTGDEMSGVLSFKGHPSSLRRARVFHNADMSNDYGAIFMMDSTGSTTPLGTVTIIPIGKNGYESQILLQLKAGDTFNDPVVNVATVRVSGIEVRGTINPSGGYDFGSSRKLKEVEGELPYGLAEVRQVATLIGRYKREYNADGRRRLFFDAEQMMGIMPEVVDPAGVMFGGEAVATIKLDQALPPAYRAIAELAAMVDALNDEVRNLREARSLGQ